MESNNTGDIQETSISYFSDGAKGMHCILYTTKQSIRDACVKRNPPIRETSDSHGYMLYYSRDQIRHPKLWVKFDNEVEAEEE